jgi:disulfide bond formation protein DsbB
MTRNALIIFAAGGSLALLLAAWGFQHLGGLAPCVMCIWQRWPHAAAVLIGGASLAVSGVLLPLLGALAALSTAGVGLYHTGVERGWWEGPSTCTSGSIEGLSTSELMDQILTAPLVQCDQVVWAFAGLSMASWNALISLVLTMLWLMAAAKSRA